jgi:LysM repeat protein
MRIKIILCFLVLGLLATADIGIAAQGNSHPLDVHYIIKKGDCLSLIAQRYGVETEELAKKNNIKKTGVIYAGDVLVIPVGSKEKKEKQEVKTETYVVKKGDTIWGISREFGISHQRLIEVNGISDPDLIFPGQKIAIPDPGVFYWRNVNASPYTKTPADPEHLEKGLRLLGFSSRQVNSISKEMEEAVSQSIELEKGDRLEAMVFGRARVEKPVICDFTGEQPARIYETPTLKETGYKLVVPVVCGNYSLIKEKIDAQLPPRAPSFPTVPTHPGTSQEEENVERNKFEMYMGGGVSEPVHASGRGEHAWAKVRILPFWTDLSDSIDLGMGVFGYGALGSGRNSHYNYYWKRYSVGPSFKLIGENWDADFDLGIGALSSDGDEGKYKSEQRDKIYHLSAYSSFYKRRNDGEKWFPETNIGLDITVPYDTEHKHSWDGQELKPDPWDNQVVETYFKQALYDFKLDGFRITPEIHAGLGHDWGQEADFYKIGPGVSTGYEGYDFLTMSVLNYQEYLGSDADNLMWASLTLDVGNAYKAWKASRIKKIN